ncbi:MAG: hypothetical protein Q8R91_07495 [Candidatus Omnitrophota bacterium]|nr:hypothetical protein [Candidatus Omnitrophota bacterium]
MRAVNGHGVMRERGQSTAEYAIVFAVVLAALVGMQVYVKRGINARTKVVSDHKAVEFWTELGQPAEPDPTQYEPYYASSDFDVTRDAAQTEHVESGGVVKRTGVSDATTREGEQITHKAKVNP